MRNRYLSSAVDRANAGLERDGADPIGHLTPHSLRRTFASLLLATGADVPCVMAQLGHADPAMTLGVYAKVIASKTDHGAALDDLVGASTWTSLGASEKARKGTGVSGGVRVTGVRLAANPLVGRRPAGFEPATSRSGGERSIH